ncbi:MAG: RNA polymerase factor sigma-54 [Phycisphaerae bacterium]|jgi:RNA polymerase sigma-54 factor|nr:RNA polymerase factor sigma-54 [Phycisphaerae bacterium]
MHLDTLQQLRIEQKLRLAPRMIQSMEILQLPLMALEERLEQEMEKNPVLEVHEPEEGMEPSADAELVDPAEISRDTSDAGDSSADEFSELDLSENSFDADDYLDRPGSSRFRHGDEDPKLQALANTAARETSLNDYLVSQFDLLDLDEETQQMGEAIINYIDADGYLRASFETLSQVSGLPASPERWERALEKVQSLDPPGVGARTPQECFLLQLQAQPEERFVEKEVISHYFDELQNQQYQKIAHQTGFTLDQIRSAVDFIRLRLVLYPGLAVGGSPTAYVVPDVIVEYDEQTDSYKATVPENSLPKLHISSYYRRMLQDSGTDSQTRRYIRNNMQSAQWIIDAIEQRRETLRRVSQAIVDAQKGFLDNGPRFMKPLPMSQVADQLGIHVATVSRAVAEKYMLTPRGIFALRSFFMGGKETDDGRSVSYDAIREKIKEIIDAEDRTCPLNDDEIVVKLKEAGVTVARRTVAKYRKIMAIPSSHKRREK